MATPFQTLVTNPSTSAAKKLADSSFKFRSLTLVGVKSYDTSGKGVANGGYVYVGWSDKACPVRIPSGRAITLEADYGKTFDLSEVWMIPATADDGVAILAS